MALNIEAMVLNQFFVATENILVFGSNIDNRYKAAIVCGELAKMDGVYIVNVDLNDWENVLRVQCDSLITQDYIQQVIAKLGFQCYELT